MPELDPINTQQDTGGRNNKALIITAVVAVAVLALGALGFWLYGGTSVQAREAVFRTTGEVEGFAIVPQPPNTVQFVIEEKYALYDAETNERILIDSENAESFCRIDPPQEVGACLSEVDGNREENVFGFQIHLWTRGGRYEFEIKLHDGRVYRAVMDWPSEAKGLPGLGPERTGDIRIGGDGSVQTAFEFNSKEGAFDISDFNAMFHVRPDGTAEEFTPIGQNLLWLAQNQLEEGIHRFYILKDDGWYRADIDNPAHFL